MKFTQDISLQLIFLFTLAFILSTIFNSLLLKFSKNLGKRNLDENMIRWAEESKPAFGGISFYIAFLVTFAVYTILFPSPKGIDIQYTGLLAASGVAFLMGLSDDAYNTRPLLKFSIQVFCGLILVSTGTVISAFSFSFLNYIFTIFWVVALMNSINMLDNMDGITTLTSIIILLSSLTITMFYRTDINSYFFVVIQLGALASLLGFLMFNWNPSKMFMGDTGSQFLGVFLAAIGITFFWNFQENMAMESPAKQVIITFLAFIVPISDTTTVTINRLMKGSSPFIGGKDHTTHHLSYLGFTDRQVALILGSISLISTFLIFIIASFIKVWSTTYSILFISYILLVFGTLFSTTKMKKAKQKYNELENK